MTQDKSPKEVQHDLEEAMRSNRFLKSQLDAANTEITELQEALRYLTNLNIKGSGRLLLKAMYRSVKFRMVKLIWGSARYKNSEQLLSALKRPLVDHQAAESVLKALVANDAVNLELVVRDSQVRTLIYEMLRKGEVRARGKLAARKGRGNG